MAGQLDPQLQDKLAFHRQTHLIAWWDQLSTAQQQRLDAQLREVDFSLVQQLYESSAGDPAWDQLARAAQPPPAIRLNEDPAMRRQAMSRGEQALREGLIGMILVAGGQGTRLGFDYPKGMFPVGPVSRRTLFQVIIDKLRARSRRYAVPIPLYVMTSPATHEQTVQFLAAKERFGLPAEELQVFCQGTMPAVDAHTGQLLLSSRDELFSSPDGHGGMLAALGRNGCLDDILRRGIQHVFYCQIDNPLSQVCDPTTIGFHLQHDSEMTTQAVPKRDALQRVGNVVSVDGKVRIIEYSDLPDQVARQTNEDGSLRLWAGNIAVHVFCTSFLQRMRTQADAMPFHLARKKVPYVDARGKITEPEQPNAIKFERFIFDLLPHARQAIVVEVDAADAFAPIKNASGADSETPETAQGAMLRQAANWLRAAGIRLQEGVPVEVSPLFAMDAEELASKLDRSARFLEPTFIA